MNQDDIKKELIHNIDCEIKMLNELRYKVDVDGIFISDDTYQDINDRLMEIDNIIEGAKYLL